MSSIPGRGNIYSRMSFSSDQVTGTVFPHLNMPFLPNSKIYLEHCPRGEALIIIHLRFSSNEVASHVKQLPFRPFRPLLVQQQKARCPEPRWRTTNRTIEDTIEPYRWFEYIGDLFEDEITNTCRPTLNHRKEKANILDKEIRDIIEKNPLKKLLVVIKYQLN